MKKGCKSYKVNPKNSYISSKNFLVAKGAIDKYLNIIDLNGFRKEVVELTKLAKNKHNVDKGLLFGERTIYSANKPYFQAVPNKDAFSEINKVKTKAQSQEDLSDFYMGDEPLRFQEEKALSEDITYLNPVEAVEQKIESELPSEVAKSVTVLNNVPQDILGRDDLFLSLKDVLNDNVITDEVLINWAGVNKDKIGHPKSIKSDAQLRSIIRAILNKKQKEDQYVEFKVNPLALKSFKEWNKALEKYPLPFQDQMLTHALKHITNPTRKSKYVLQLSEVALTKAHGIVINKPHELNRIGKLYDQEVLATVSDSVDHEPSASGKGYWVHVPRTEKFEKFVEGELPQSFTKKEYAGDRDYTHRYFIENNKYFVNKDSQLFEDGFSRKKEITKEEYIKQSKNIDGGFEKGNIEGQKSKQFTVNVDLLRKLSPSTWCTASSMTEHYVANYDNYLLIVDGVTVAGIEAYPENHNIEQERVNEAIEDLENERKSTKDETKIKNIDKEIERLKNWKPAKIKVKEVTSRANNGVAPIDHIDDVVAFFEKHDLDLDNNSVKKAIKAKAEGKVDEDYIMYDPADAAYYEPFEEDYYGAPDWAEIARERERDELEWARDGQFVASINTIEQARANLNVVLRHFHDLSPTLRVFEDIATAAVDNDAHNITHVDFNVPFYNELAIKAVTKRPYVFIYLSPQAKEIPGLREIYERQRQLDDDLPFSKTNAKLIQGYYDPKTDKVVVIASNTPINDASKVAIHEVAHRGMLRMAKDLGGVNELSKALFAAEDQLMKKLPELLKRTGHKSLESLMLDYGFTTTSNDGKIKLLMELAARWAETLVNKPKPAWWKEFLKSIKNWIAKFTGVILDEKEVDELVGGFVKYGTGDSTKDIPVSTPETTQNQELFLYLSKEMSDKLGYNNPGSTAAPSIKDIITRIPVINQTDIDNKKLEC